MKSHVRGMIPGALFLRLRRLRRYWEERRNLRSSVEEVFTRIYARNEWGGRRDEFCSGAGSSDDQIVSAYVSMVSARAADGGFLGRTFIDLGCGDFSVGRRLIPLCSNYIGVDIVRPLIKENQDRYATENVRFECLDIVQGELPTGDVCFLRQVLQHLSNEQIKAILAKLAQYRWVFITEHYPSTNDAIRPNLDRVHGRGIRAYDNSGVYLAEPPFSLPEQSLELALEVRGTDLGAGHDPGVIRTYLYRPFEASS